MSPDCLPIFQHGRLGSRSRSCPLAPGSSGLLSLQIALDGADIRSLNLTWLRQQMSLVSQEPHLFTGTILDNIRYGQPAATDEEVEQAAMSANALDFIQAAPQGFQTPVRCLSHILCI